MAPAGRVSRAGFRNGARGHARRSERLGVPARGLPGVRIQRVNMDHDSRIYVAGHRGLAGSAIVRTLQARGYEKLITRTHAELDLTEQAAVRGLFAAEQPEYVFLAAARVGGILAYASHPGEFIRDNLAVQTNVIHEAWRCGVQK